MQSLMSFMSFMVNLSTMKNTARPRHNQHAGNYETRERYEKIKLARRPFSETAMARGA